MLLCIYYTQFLCFFMFMLIHRNLIMMINIKKKNFLSRFSFTDNNSQGSREREGTIFYSTLPLPPAHEHSDIYLQLCTWDDCHIFLIATLVFTRLLTRCDLPPHRITIWLIDSVMLIFLCLLLLVELIFRICYSYMTWRTGGLELASTMILVLQADRLAKCASNP